MALVDKLNEESIFKMSKTDAVKLAIEQAAKEEAMKLECQKCHKVSVEVPDDIFYKHCDGMRLDCKCGGSIAFYHERRRTRRAADGRESVERKTHSGADSSPSSARR